MIVDLDGYRVKHQSYIVRELGLYSLQHGSCSWFFENKLPYLSLEKRDRKTVNYVYHHIHGLRFESSKQEKAHPQHMVNIWSTYGQKNLLNELQIPCVNLEDFGCPKIETLVAIGLNPGFSCGHHTQPQLHCPKQETYLFYQWMQSVSHRFS